MTAHQARFDKFVQRGDSGCWPWVGARREDGYGRFFLHGKNALAHRVAYELAFDPIPPDLVVDHLCRNRCCVNPGHMELVSRSENVKRGDHTGMGWKRNVTHCPQGHEYTPDNTYIKTPLGRQKRVCKTCHSERRTRSAN